MIAQTLLLPLDTLTDHERVSDPFTVSPWLTRHVLSFNVTHIHGPFWGLECRIEFYVDGVDVWAPYFEGWSPAPSVLSIGQSLKYFGDYGAFAFTDSASCIAKAPLRLRVRGKSPHTTGARVAYSVALLTHTATTIGITHPLVASPTPTI